MNFIAQYISYRLTGSFSPIVYDYVEHHSKLRSFYKFEANVDGIKKAIEIRSQFTVNRSLLVSQLNKQYEQAGGSDLVRSNIQSLAEQNTYTVCTAHQPNIFTGHLYFLYKIAHIIKLAEELNAEIPDARFVPVFYMGSEDADLDELGEITINDKKYKWQTKQKGAVGRMKVDSTFITLIDEIEAQLSVEKFGGEIIAILRRTYQPGSTIEESTFRLVNELFGKYGLVVLLPDNAALKKEFVPVVSRELEEQFSNKVVQQTINHFPTEYKVQAAGREINLFYLKDELRERIEANHQGFRVANTGIHFTKDEISSEIQEHPDRFSPNVILRPLFQEMILPNVAFIGGGGELAYWLELRKLFEEARVPYPVLVLRNSFTVINHNLSHKIHALSYEPMDFFRHENELVTEHVSSRSELSLSLHEEKSRLLELYEQIKDTAVAVDVSLQKHVIALCKQALHKLEALEKKMLKAEKKKFEAQIRQIKKIRSLLFPGGILQERVENLLPFYAQYGPAFIDMIYENSKGLDQEYCIVEESG
jgi:bacillithiol synthase